MATVKVSPEPPSAMGAGDIQIADGARAWFQMAQVVLAEETSVREFAALLRERINDDAIAVFKEVAIPLMRNSQADRQIQISEASAGTAAAIEDMIATAYDEKSLMVLVPKPADLEEPSGEQG